MDVSASPVEEPERAFGNHGAIQIQPRKRTPESSVDAFPYEGFLGRDGFFWIAQRWLNCLRESPPEPLLRDVCDWLESRRTLAVLKILTRLVLPSSTASLAGLVGSETRPPCQFSSLCFNNSVRRPIGLFYLSFLFRTATTKLGRDPRPVFSPHSTSRATYIRNDYLSQSVFSLGREAGGTSPFTR